MSEIISQLETLVHAQGDKWSVVAWRGQTPRKSISAPNKAEMPSPPSPADTSREELAEELDDA